MINSESLIEEQYNINRGYKAVRSKKTSILLTAADVEFWKSSPKSYIIRKPSGNSENIGSDKSRNIDSFIVALEDIFV